MTRPPAPAAAPEDSEDGAAAPEEQPEAPSRVFYGNEQYYVFFRLHQYLYDRCAIFRAVVTYHRAVVTYHRRSSSLAHLTAFSLMCSS